MKKYLLSLIPFVLCTLVASIFFFSGPPADDPSPDLTQKEIDYMTYTWFLMGAVLSLLFFFIILSEDIFSRLGKRSRERMLR